MEGPRSELPDVPLVSVVCPVYNEEASILEFHKRTSHAMASIEPPVRWELLFVDDGSRDDSAALIRKICADDPTSHLLRLSRNFGHQKAITAGIDAARGDAVVVIDSDLQDPPEVIAGMVARWREGDKVVYGVRRQRQGESAFKLVTAKVFYRVINWLSDIQLPLDAGDFRLMDRQVVDALGEIREENRYMRGLVTWVGFEQSALEFERDPRFAGTTNYPLPKLIRLALDGITSFSERPLRLALQVGTLITLLAVLLVSWIVASRIVSPESSRPGFASLMVVLLFLGGVQLMSIGLLGEYVGRIYRETKQRPLYIVAERIGPADEIADAAPSPALGDASS